MRQIPHYFVVLRITYYITKKRVFDRIFQVVVRFGFHASPSSFCNDYTTSFDRCAHHSSHKVSPDVEVYTVRVLHIFIVIYEIVSHRAAFFFQTFEQSISYTNSDPPQDEVPHIQPSLSQRDSTAPRRHRYSNIVQEQQPETPFPA